MRRTPSVATVAVLAAALIAIVLGRGGGARTPQCMRVDGKSGVLFHVARIFDGERIALATDLLVVDGTIAAMGTIACVDMKGGALEIVEARTTTLLPGFIDAHTHRSDEEESLTEAISFGVTTEVDMGGALPARLDAIRAKDDPKLADVIGAGMYITAPGGHGTEYGEPIPTLAHAEDARAFVDARIAEGSQFIKLIISSGMPKLGPDEALAVVNEAHLRGKLVVAHVNTRDDAEVAVNAGVDGLAHLFVDRRNGHLSDGTTVSWDPIAVRDLVRLMSDKHVFVIPTLDMLQMACGISTGLELFADPHIEPRLTARARMRLSATAWGTDSDHKCYAHVKESVALLRGVVPILAGTDAPNEGAAHGASIHREMALLVEAGLTPIEALRAATSAPADAFEGLRGRGRIGVGKRGDVVIVEGDPTGEIRETSGVKGVWKRGVKAW